jgi:hypothetical protein
MANRLTRLICAALVLPGLLLVSTPAVSLSFKRVWAVDLRFEARATALPAGERTKLASKLDEVRRSGDCVEYVISHGDAEIGVDGDMVEARRVALERANFVANLLRTYGIPAALIYSHIPPAVLTNSAAAVEIVSIRRGALPCM